jgi:hypothetical protein
MTGLQKFGGLLGLYKFSIFLAWMHKRRFEKKHMRRIREEVNEVKALEDGSRVADEGTATVHSTPDNQYGLNHTSSQLITTQIKENLEERAAANYEKELFNKPFGDIYSFENFRKLLVRIHYMEIEMREIKGELAEIK